MLQASGRCVADKRRLEDTIRPAVVRERGQLSALFMGLWMMRTLMPRATARRRNDLLSKADHV